MGQNISIFRQNSNTLLTYNRISTKKCNILNKYSNNSTKYFSVLTKYINTSRKYNNTYLVIRNFNFVDIPGNCSKAL